jgi:HAD superfamily hydrolase (TIGR01490 family)
MEIAVFDFDGTITQKDTFLQFITHSKGRRSLIIGLFRYSHLIVLLKLKLYPNWKVKQKIFSFFFKGITNKEFQKWCISFADEIDKSVRTRALEKIYLHQKNAVVVSIVSASIENWIIPWAAQKGIDYVIGTKIEVDEKGMITGRFLSMNCYGQEKCNRLLEIFPDRKSYKLYAYGDSRGDREILKLADEGYFKMF